MFNRRIKRILNIPEVKSYIIKQGGCEILEKINNLRLIKTLRNLAVSFKFRSKLYNIYFSNLEFNSKQVKLLSNGLKNHSKIHVNILYCWFTEKALFYLGRLICNVKYFHLKGLLIKNGRQLQSFVNALDYFYSNYFDIEGEIDIKLRINRHILRRFPKYKFSSLQS